MFCFVSGGTICFFVSVLTKLGFEPRCCDSKEKQVQEKRIFITTDLNLIVQKLILTIYFYSAAIIIRLSSNRLSEW